MSVPFSFDPRLEADSVPVADLALSAVRLSRDGAYPWAILVPRRPGATELIDLTAPERALLMEEIAQVSAALKVITGCDKLNVAAIGNVVSQLHIHVVARFRDDRAWPGPIWGRFPAAPRTAEAEVALVADLRAALGA